MKQTFNVAKQKRDRAEAITKRRTLYAAGAGLIPFPIIDVATLLVVQVNMIKDIAKVYGVEEHFRKKQVQTFVTTLIGDLGTLGVVSGVKALPLVGGIVGVATAPITSAASTYALGKVFTNHFDQGGNLLDFDPVTSRRYFYKEFKAGQELVKEEGMVTRAAAPQAEVAASTEEHYATTVSKEELISESKRLLSALVILQQKIERHSKATQTTVNVDYSTTVAAAEVSQLEVESQTLVSNVEVTEDTTVVKTSATGKGSEKKKKAKRRSKRKEKSLTLIEGIGPGIEKVLNNEGVYSFHDLATCEVSELEDMLKRAGGKFNFAKPATWPEQAQLAAGGKMEELAILQKELEGGKRKKDND